MLLVKKTAGYFRLLYYECVHVALKWVLSPPHNIITGNN